MPDEEFSFEVNADFGDLESKLESAGEAGHEAGEHIKEGAEEGGEGLAELKEHANQVTEAFAGLKDPLSALAGAFGLAAIGEMFHEVSEKTVEAANEIQLFAARSQMSLDEAREQISTMESLGISSTTASMAFRKLGAEVESGGAKLKKLGIEIEEGGKVKGLGELYDEVAEKLSHYGNNAKEAGAAQALLGRGGQILVSTFEAQKLSMENLSAVAKGLGIETDKLVERGNVQLQLETELNEVWTVFAQSVSPIVITSLKILTTGLLIMAEGVNTLKTVTLSFIEVIRALATAAAAAFPAVVSGVQAIGASFGHLATGNIMGLMSDIDKVKKSAADAMAGVRTVMNDSITKEKDIWGDWLKQTAANSKAVENQWNGFLDEIAKARAKGMGSGATGTGGPDFTKAKQGADQLAAALDAVNQKEGDAARIMSKLGEEVQKDSSQAFGAMVNTVSTDFDEMQAAFEKFKEAVESGNKKAAKDAEEQWKNALHQFEVDSKAAQQQFQQDQKAMQEQAKQTSQIISGELTGIANAFMSGQKNALSNLWRSEMTKLVDETIKGLTKMAVEWAVQHGVMQSISTNFFSSLQSIWNGIGQIFSTLVNSIRSAFGAIGGAMQSGVSALRSANAQQIASNTSVGVTGAGASQASIPYVGPALALAAMAMMAAEMATHSAAGGFDVPPGLSPLTQLHPSEMVLPASLANVVRGAAGGGGGGGGPTNVNMNVHAVDAGSVVDLLRSSGSDLADLVARQVRLGQNLFQG